MKKRLRESEERVNNIEGEVYNNMASVDELQQYLRRDCLEIILVYQMYRWMILATS